MYRASTGEAGDPPPTTGAFVIDAHRYGTADDRPQSPAASGLASLDGHARALLIGLAYLWRHGRIPRLGSPRRFTELVQHRKLFDRNPRYPQLIDKVAVKDLVSALLGPRWVTPTLWSGPALPQRPRWQAPFVVKSRHGCNQRAFVRSDREDWPGICRQADRWMGSTYGRWLAEWGYEDVPRGLLVEPFLGCTSRLPVDYKIYVFHGRAACVQVHLDREHDHRWTLFDRDWRRMSRDTGMSTPPPPRTLVDMLAAAERLGRDFDFVRIDFYEIDGQPRFGEMTFYPGSGLDPFDPDGLDVILGRYWNDPAALSLSGDQTPA